VGEKVPVEEIEKGIKRTDMTPEQIEKLFDDNYDWRSDCDKSGSMHLEEDQIAMSREKFIEVVSKLQVIEEETLINYHCNSCQAMFEEECCCEFFED
jgi:hypothetical protein